MARLKEPAEDMFYKYPVLKIPTEAGEDLVVGMFKAQAILKYIDAIREFVEKHSSCHSREGGNPVVTL